MKPTSIMDHPVHATRKRAGAAHHRGQHGLTLIEVMISITISLILLAGVMQIFTSSRQTYRVQDSMARLQENGRFALSFLSRDVRNADFRGAAGVGAALAVGGTNGVTPPIPDAPDTIALINVGGTLAAITYSILPDGANLDVAGNPEPTLFQTVGGGGAAVALVEGVENMQILYGEDLDARPAGVPLTALNFSANRYVPAGTAGLVMANVVSVRIGLVLRTKENNLSTVVQTYNFNGEVVTPADRRLRRVFSTTIGLRNRGG